MTNRQDAPIGSTRFALDQPWTLRAGAGPLPDGFPVTTAGTVPGCVHTDLLDAGLIPDPFLDANDAALAWIGLVDWTYETTFDWSPVDSDRTDLVLEGLDTVATILLNGVEIASVENQHRSYRVDVRDQLIDGRNDLVVRFRSPIKHANAESARLGMRPRSFLLPYDAIRKSASSFGWDWGLATYTSGIVKPVYLESWSSARLARTSVVATPAGDGGTVTVVAELERSRSEPLSLTVRVQGESRRVLVERDATTATVTVEVPDVERWWPRGFGQQPLYDVAVDVRTAEGAIVDRRSRKVGFRDVRWDMTPDAAGTPFALVVNDQPVFVKGANWIPDDALTVRVTREKIERRFAQALDANINLLRVWGGGLYESDDFYELADEMGLLIWQDFLFACAAYSEDEPLRSEIDAEARENIVRLAHHASLVLLSGNNENLWGYEVWGWKQRLDGRSWGAYYYYQLLPQLVEELAPHVTYIPGSPFSPGMGWDGAQQTGPHPNDEHHGSMHMWDPWFRVDWAHYRDRKPRFVAEFGWQGPPAWSTLTRSVSDSPLTPESPGMIAHQKAAGGNILLTNGLVPHFRLPSEMEDWHWAMQLNQALAVRTALEHFRSWAPHTQGAIVWQLNDCWPVTSWAAIDGDERVKPLYYGLKKAYAPRIVTIQPREEELAAVLVNDTSEPWEARATIRRMSFAGDEIDAFDATVTVDPRGTTTIPLPEGVALPADAARELLVADIGEIRGVWFFVEPRDSVLPQALVDVQSRATDEGTEVTLTAYTLVRDLTLLVDKIRPEAIADDALITILPGETRTIRVRHDGGLLSPGALADARVLRTANELVHAEPDIIDADAVDDARVAASVSQNR